jgi:hypothetical protein
LGLPCSGGPEIFLVKLGLGSFLQGFLSRELKGRESVACVNTATRTYSDAETLGAMTSRKSFYPIGTKIYRSDYEPGNIILNLEEETLVVDSINWLVSNWILRLNYEIDMKIEIQGIIKGKVQELMDSFHYPYGIGCGSKRIYLISSSIDFDYFPLTQLGELYQKVLFEINAVIASYDRVQTVMLMGTEPWKIER